MHFAQDAPSQRRNGEQSFASTTAFGRGLAQLGTEVTLGFEPLQSRVNRPGANRSGHFPLKLFGDDHRIRFRSEHRYSQQNNLFELA
jgi:hypothetical protein